MMINLEIKMILIWKLLNRLLRSRSRRRLLRKIRKWKRGIRRRDSREKIRNCSRSSSSKKNRLMMTMRILQMAKVMRRKLFLDHRASRVTRIHMTVWWTFKIQNLKKISKNLPKGLIIFSLSKRIRGWFQISLKNGYKTLAKRPKCKAWPQKKSLKNRLTLKRGTNKKPQAQPPLQISSLPLRISTNNGWI